MRRPPDASDRRRLPPFLVALAGMLVVIVALLVVVSATPIAPETPRRGGCQLPAILARRPQDAQKAPPPARNEVLVVPGHGGQVVGPGTLRTPAPPQRVVIAHDARPGLLDVLTAPGEPPIGFTTQDCDKVSDGGPVLAGCMTDELRCGDVIAGHTRGGARTFNSRFYEKEFCTPRTTNHDGGDERVYKLVIHEPQTRVLAYLDTPCADLDLAVFPELTGDTCPNVDAGLARCEMDVSKGPAKPRKFVDIRDTEPTTYWIVVEGQDDAQEGPFALSVLCEPW